MQPVQKRQRHLANRATDFEEYDQNRPGSGEFGERDLAALQPCEPEIGSIGPGSERLPALPEGHENSVIGSRRREEI